ncbi:DNA-binding protein S1FA3 [Citrus sinensis]|uniref:DNA-binding protein S1FA3 n=1 Tax=Citrus sinensis TaxID=2711 RepID=A0ACB8JU80_CITSI|nr:DNA-binding protein S1FA3 [Citrus sinensis]KAH9735340.1 DNA-binding protein S1FA3 [Citrus sinensis]
MDEEFEFGDKAPPSFDRVNVTCFNDKQGNTVKDAGAKGFNPGLIVLLVVGGLLLVFLIGNYILYMYAQKTLPPKKKKPVSKKKMKKERLKQGVSAPGE